MSNFTKIRNAIEQEQYDESVSFDSFMEKLCMTKSDYIKAIQSTLKNTIVFVKRKSTHTWNNSFAIKRPDLWQENTNAQYILNTYVVVAYCSLYMIKVDKSLIDSFKRIHKEHKTTKIDVIQMIQTLGNTLLNLQQMSTQLATHLTLSLPLNSSQENVFS